MKLCKDCKHFVPESRYFSLCKAVGVSMVDGAPSMYCSTARQAGRECGKDALLFEPALPSPPPLVSVGQFSPQKACRSAIGWVVVGSVVTVLLFSMFK